MPSDLTKKTSGNKAKQARKEPARAAVERCLDAFGPGAMSRGARADAKATRAFRGRVDDKLNIGKREKLEFVQRRLAMEAERVAAFQMDLWARTGRIPSLAGTIKFKNLPGAYLGQALWAQVAGQIKSWVSNAERAFLADLLRLCEPGAMAPISGSRKEWAKWQERKANEAKNPLAKPPSAKKQAIAAKAERALRLRAQWGEAIDAPAESALAAFQALGLAAGEAREALAAAAWTPARRGAENPASPAQALARAIWERTASQRGKPTWKNIPFQGHPRMCKIAGPEELEPQGRANGAAFKGQKPSASAKAAGKKGKRRPKAERVLILTLPLRSEWPSRSQIEEDWRKAIVDAPAGLEAKEKKEERLAREKAAIEKALAAGEEPPAFEDPFKGYAKRAKLEKVAIPFFAGDGLGPHPGKLADTAILLPPRADARGRGHWQIRLSKTLNGEDLAELAGLGGPRRGAGCAGIDAGLLKAMSTSVGAPGGTPARVALGGKRRWRGQEPEGDAAAALRLAFLLPGWKETLAPLADAATRAAAELQRRGREKLVGEPSWEKAQGRLTGRIKNEIEAAVKAWVAAVRPTAVCVEDLDLSGPNKGAETNRLILYMGHGVMRRWLEENADLHGFEFHKENAAHSSAQCGCGVVEKEFRRGERYECGRCGASADADANAGLRLQERFLLGKWLAALGEEGRGLLGLAGAPIALWMRPPKVKAALAERERFLLDEGRVRQAKAAGLLPAGVERIARQRQRIGREIARREKAEREKGGISGSPGVRARAGEGANPQAGGGSRLSEVA